MKVLKQFLQFHLHYMAHIRKGFAKIVQVLQFEAVQHSSQGTTA